MSGQSEPANQPSQLPSALRDELFAVLLGDPHLRNECFARLLAAHPEAAEVLQANWQYYLRAEEQSSESGPNGDPILEQTIHGYRLLRVLGEGGMGVVYRAEQIGAVRRLVAIKVVKSGLDGTEVRARFELERQSLAAMDHESIARVFDCGTDTNGHPWFAMELVEGLPLHRYCDDRGLPLRSRIELFLQVCEGVQHAHQKGVIHRDLKPGNLLVVDRDDHPVVKIIDFGVAREIERSVADSLAFTEHGIVVGTPEYMSPEQARGDARAIDTRTDIYALGVVLYELLVGTLPFPVDQLRQAGLQEIVRRICDEEPAKPSTALTSLGAALSECALRRRIGAEELRRELAVDLDWVILTAMAKEPERRYPSANALAEDLRRYLAHEPLRAGPPSSAYRLRKLLQRHRGQVVAGLAVFATALVGAVAALQFALGERARVREFELLSGVVRHGRLMAAEQLLYPAWPAQIPEMERWRRECRQLLDLQPAIDETLAELRYRALPAAAEQIERDRRSHPRYREWLELGHRIAALRRAQAIREGRDAAVEPPLTREQDLLNAWSLCRLAAGRVYRRDRAAWVFGEQDLGLSMARAAVARAAGTDIASECLDVLAWALHWNGRDDEATQRAAEAVACAADTERLERVEHQRELEREIALAGEVLARAEGEHRELAGTLAAYRLPEFPSDEGAARFLYESLVDLAVKFAAVRDLDARIEREQLGWARQIGALTRVHPNAKYGWDEVRRAVATNPRYAGQSIPLGDDEVIGLVPIGENPATRLWEFYDLRSAWDGRADPRTLAIPQHDANDGKLAVKDETGIVFVLLPGATVVLGAQRDPQQPNPDPDAEPGEGLHEVTLAPFLCSRYETTQGQWTRLWTWYDERRRPSRYPPGFRARGTPTPLTLAHPVEGVTWAEADLLASRHGMALPTDAQWEYACRGGSVTAWWSGAEPASLDGCANLADRTAARWTKWGQEPFDDGFVVHAPVGSFRPNGFGLHDVHGNVHEWTRDAFGPYGFERPGDGLRPHGSSTGHAYRGGAFNSPAANARSARRYNAAEPLTGVRLVRSLRVD